MHPTKPVFLIATWIHESNRQVGSDVREFPVSLKMPQRRRIDVDTFHSMWLNSIYIVENFSCLHVVSELKMGSPPAAEYDSLA
ncbi:hypothetical protein PsorP6_011555 [Peronosclerospora sorghi]|uniref:Uncharacterized protein n=1 Tax=Peronosclerospora sorghi TaxID=230839 RepID=A0ACC0WMI5_9STRA|nr:hypothetical protein PsorP6_011555 [Peronosclerospora sorghi]